MLRAPVSALCRPAAGLLLAAALSGAVALAQPPTGPPAATPDVQKELAQLQEQVARLDPKAPDYSTRVKGILQDLVRANQALAQENAALRLQLAGAGRASRASSAAATSQPSGPVGFFAKKGLTKYHRTGCRVGEVINPSTRTTFADSAAAKAAGLEPCKICRPEAVMPAPAPPAGGAGANPR